MNNHYNTSHDSISVFISRQNKKDSFDEEEKFRTQLLILRKIRDEIAKIRRMRSSPLSASNPTSITDSFHRPTGFSLSDENIDAELEVVKLRIV